MRGKQWLILVAMTIATYLNSCKKNSNVTNAVVPDAAPDSILSLEDLTFINSLPVQNYTNKSLYLDNGQTIYDYLSAIDPQQLTQNITNPILKYNSISTVQFTDDDEIQYLTAVMGNKAAFLAKFPYQDQVNGLAYVYGSKNYNVKKVGTIYNKSPSKCQTPYYGLDCSGFIYQLTLQANLHFKPVAGEYFLSSQYYSDPNNWNNAFKQLGYPNIQMKNFPPGSISEVELKPGDIIYFNKGTSVDHIGIILKGRDASAVFFASNGSPLVGCDYNTLRTEGPKEINLSGIAKHFTSWGVLRMSSPRIVYSRTINIPTPRYYEAEIGLGSKFFLVGGKTSVGNNSTNVDVYDTLSKQWSTHLLSVPRSMLAVASVGNIVMFAGGETESGYTDAVDIYDTKAKAWLSPAHLSQPRAHLAGAAAGNIIAFGGGDDDNGYLNTVDFFDISKSQLIWHTSTQLASSKRKLGAAASGNFIMFAGGEGTNAISQTGDLFDVSNKNFHTTTTLLEPFYGSVGLGAGDKIVFIGNNTGSLMVYDVVLKTWSYVSSIPNQFYTAAGSANNFILFATLAIDNSGTVTYNNTVSEYYMNVTSNAMSLQKLEYNSSLTYFGGAGTGNTIMLIGTTKPTSSVGLSTHADIYSIVTR